MLEHDSSYGKRLGACQRIGYMPQETALVNELTVKETVYFFGRIFQVSQKALKERFSMIRDLLELPDDDCRIDHCSGGQKRRVSLAAAMIHQPDLLILDEPTVGLDCLLREKIWDFLWNLTRTTKLSVLLTTHYILEAEKSDKVGMMRNGILLAEDSPARIISQFNVSTLEVAFLEACTAQERDEKYKDIRVETTDDEPLQQARENDNEPSKTDVTFSILRWQLIQAFLCKQFIQFKRQPP